MGFLTRKFTQVELATDFNARLLRPTFVRKNPTGLPDVVNDVHAEHHDLQLAAIAQARAHAQLGGVRLLRRHLLQRVVVNVAVWPLGCKAMDAAKTP
ncbi:hypothetical protein [Limnohabitans sp. Bal53]|uniref:hypothetical protein n=1 Tax=Limnohabitans sp. Bal53 TaxID=1977910 RepID=UPI0011B230D7|nr:hypothetical protein [Limnohabitans sp. Bal53]